MIPPRARKKREVTQCAAPRSRPSYGCIHTAQTAYSCTVYDSTAILKVGGRARWLIGCSFGCSLGRSLGLIGGLIGAHWGLIGCNPSRLDLLDDLDSRLHHASVLAESRPCSDGVNDHSNARRSMRAHEAERERESLAPLGPIRPRPQTWGAPPVHDRDVL